RREDSAAGRSGGGDPAAGRRAEAVAEEGGGGDAGGEGGGGRGGGGERPVHPVVVLLEPQQPAQQRVFGGGGAQCVGDPGGLRAAVLAGAELAHHQRLARGDRADDPVVGGAEELVEAHPPLGRGRVGAPVVAVEAGPVDVGVARVEG